MSRKPIIGAIVTGASAGIGRELVRQLATHKQLPDLTIVATARRADRLHELEQSLPPAKILPFPADLTNETDRAALFEFALKHLPQLDLVVNNAGLGAYGPFEKMNPTKIHEIFAVDFEAVADLTARAIREMRPRGSGQIVQISSILGEVGLPYSAAYVAAKHAVNGLVKSVRYELACSGISLWAACPGQTVSEFRQIAGSGHASQNGKSAEPVEKVVASLVKAIVAHQKRALFYPTWKPWTIAHLARISPRLWDFLMIRYGRQIASEDIGPEN
ncbi:MAG: SDR family NAD(P)-dependent oxidoreductase [Isosphaeraceae bacterium]